MPQPLRVRASFGGLVPETGCTAMPVFLLLSTRQMLQGTDAFVHHLDDAPEGPLHGAADFCRQSPGCVHMPHTTAESGYLTVYLVQIVL